VFIEIPKGSSVKYEIDKESGVIMVDRFVYGPLFYPYNYGFIPGTHAEDGDALDVAVLSTYPVQTGTAIVCRIIGMLEMEDEEGIDTKIIAVPTKKIDPFMAEIETIDDVPDMVKQQLKNYFDTYKDLEPNKWVKTKDFLGKDAAIEAIKKSME
jgi:inorganic pyrophosphatase